jgi:hypothetical protein
MPTGKGGLCGTNGAGFIAGCNGAGAGALAFLGIKVIITYRIFNVAKFIGQ